MKVLLKSKNTDVYVVKEIVDMGYRKLTSPYDGDTTSGLFMQCHDTNWIYIPDISKEECNRICEEIFTQMGCLDLRKYGQCFFY